MCVDEKQQDTKTPIVFSEWTFPFNDAQIQRKDYSFAELLFAADQAETVKTTGQMSLFVDKSGEAEPTFLQQYITHYRRLCENGE